MATVAVGSAWTHEWADICRYIIFQDERLKELMMIPAGTTILNFFEKYFIEAGYTNKVLKDEDVRITFAFLPVHPLGMQTIREELSIDIFVRNEHSHDACDDMLIKRAQLIADRLNYLIGRNQRMVVPKDKDSVEKKEVAYKFNCVGMSDLGTTAIGYSRFNIAFDFNKTV